MENHYLHLFSNCQLVKGPLRSIICDLQNHEFDYIPNSLHSILQETKDKEIRVIRDTVDDDDKSIFDEYIEFIIKKGYGTFLFKNELELFPKLSLEWDTPYNITNVIIDIKNTTELNFSKLRQELDQLGCQALQLRFFENSWADLNLLLSFFNDSRLRHINISHPYIDMDKNTIKNLFIKNQRLHFITFWNSPFEEVILFDDLDAALIYSTVKTNNHKYCGEIYERDMISNISLFTEAQHHNTCLNRKISIDVEGNIKNCPSMAQSFGNIRDTTLQEALEHPDFKKYWNVKKDQISVCKDCEFRYICTDCRAYIENPEDMYSKPLKCGYNPYTAEWEEWSTNPLKQKAIDHYGMREMV